MLIRHVCRRGHFPCVRPLLLSREISIPLLQGGARRTLAGGPPQVVATGAQLKLEQLQPRSMSTGANANPTNCAFQGAHFHSEFIRSLALEEELPRGATFTPARQEAASSNRAK